MNFRWLNTLLWGNSIALAWMWGLGLFFSVQITFMYGYPGLFLFAVPNAIGLATFGILTQIVARRHGGGPETLALFFDRFAKPFRLIFFLYQVVALSLTVFALVKYLFIPLGLTEGDLLTGLFVCLIIGVILAAGALFGEEFGIQKIKWGHALMGILVLACVSILLIGTRGFEAEQGARLSDVPTWDGPGIGGLAVPLIVGLFVGPWLDLQHWQRAIQIHRERTSIRASYILGGLIFFLLLIFHGSLAHWVLNHAGGIASMGMVEEGLEKFNYAHHLITAFFANGGVADTSILPLAYFAFLCLCILSTLDSGYIALKWFFAGTVDKSQNMLVSLVPRPVLISPLPTFFLVALIAAAGLLLQMQLEYFMVFFASFFVGYASLAIARCFVPNSQQPLPQIRMFSMASMSMVIFAFGYFAPNSVLLTIGALLPMAYVVWLVFNTDLLRVVTERAGEVMEAAAEIPALKAITKTAQVATGAGVHPPQDGHALGGHFEGKWFVYSMIASYADTNSVGNVYFGMYAMFVGKTRELFFNKAMPDFDLKTSDFYILTRSFEHKFVRESREFDTITVKIRVADFNRKFCTLEHQIFGTEGELLGKGKQSLLFVSSRDYSLLDIPAQVHKAFMPYL